jgi:lipopolysaccharide transport system permease protein
VYYRDVGNILGYIMSGWMYATPIVYAISMVPEGWHMVYRLNPMTNVIEGFRWALLGVGQPSNLMLLLSTLLVLPVLISGAYYFRRTERTIVDIA